MFQPAVFADDSVVSLSVLLVVSWVRVKEELIFLALLHSLRDSRVTSGQPDALFHVTRPMELTPLADTAIQTRKLRRPLFTRGQPRERCGFPPNPSMMRGEPGRGQGKLLTMMEIHQQATTLGTLARAANLTRRKRSL